MSKPTQDNVSPYKSGVNVYYDLKPLEEAKTIFELPQMLRQRGHEIHVGISSYQ